MNEITSHKKNPWDCIDNAFSPMFNEHITINVKDGFKYSILVSVFYDITDDVVLEEYNMNSNGESIQFIFKDSDWNNVSNVSRGDVIERPELNGKVKKYSVTEVIHDSNIGNIIKARSLKK